MWPFRKREPEPTPAPPPPAREVVAFMDDSVDQRLLVYHDPSGQQAEQYRAFRTNLRAMNPRDEPRTLLFTSANPGEGKSVTVANIACALAESDALQVCLVDGDMRGGNLHRLFGCAGAPGLTNVLVDGTPPRKALQATSLKNLTLLSAGRPADNPGELFASAYLQELIGFLKRSYQYVIFDTPPVLAFADACEMAKLMDGVLLVVAIEETRKREAERSLAQLASVGANVIGTFVTGASPEDEGRPTVADEAESSGDE